jgi:AcrR family transcriptional regulator
MPKQIIAVKERLLQSAKHILKEEGYTALSMRRVATDCSIAVGTVYNYVHSKEELVALVMMEDWETALAHMDLGARESEGLVAGFQAICSSLEAFVQEYREVWNQYAGVGAGAAAGAVASHHQQLREQIAEQITHLFKRHKRQDLVELSSLFAESVLTVTMQPDMDASLICTLMNRLS